jgi:mono/diheme cytochrome c family protein
MKKFFLLSSVLSAIFLLSNCGPSKKATAAIEPAPAPKTTYEGSMTTVVMANCSPCHIPAKGGNKKAYDNYANVKADIDEIIRRIELNPGERGFMPFRKQAKLSDSTINVFKQWKTDGMLQN